SPAAIHWATQIFTLGTLTIVFLLGWKLFSLDAGFYAAAFAAFLTTDPHVRGNAANTEIFMILPLTAALWTAVVGVQRDSLTWSFVTGVLAAAAMLFKQVAVLNVFFL